MRPEETAVLLIRHGHTGAIGRTLVGRTRGVHLTAEGREQATRLRDRLRAVPIAHLYASPLERTFETAEPLAAARALAIEPDDRLIEVEFGEWTGLSFEELAVVPSWQRFNSHRATADVPGGERAAAVQARIVAFVESMHQRHRGEVVAAVTHADVVRAAVLHYAGASLDMVHRIDVTPASVTGFVLGDGYARILFVNNNDFVI